MKKLKVESYGLGDEVIKMRQDGISYAKIADKLNEKYQTPFNFMDIKRFLDRHYTEMSKEVIKDEKAKEEAIQEFRAINKQLDFLMKEMWIYFKKVKERNDVSPKMISAAGQLLRLLETRHKFLQPVVSSKKPTVKQKINIIQITDNIETIVEKLKSLGFVVINEKLLDEKLKERLKRKRILF